MKKSPLKITLFISSILFIGILLLHNSVSIILNAKDVSTAADTNLFNETAGFLSGKTIPKNSVLFKYSKSSFYKKYSKNLNDGWNKFQKPNLNKMRKWWSKYSPKEYSKNILYPFSGPDIMNALTLFPEGEKFTMFGLEKPGMIPEPHKMNSKQIRAGLTGLKRSLGTIFRHNFFRTNGMKKNLSNRSFNGITGLLMFFLGLNNYEIRNVRKIAIDSKSNLVEGIKSDNSIRWQNPPRSKRIPGVEITFRKGSGKEKRLRYFMLNVIDYALTKYSPNFIPYIIKEEPYTTVIKSASYLMHNDKIKFTKIRKAVLKVSDYIIQDDSGIPLRYLPSDKWKVKFHGYYNRPIPMFKKRFQKDLKYSFKKYSTGILPFSYGYNFKIGRSNLITAEKIKE